MQNIQHFINYHIGLYNSVKVELCKVDNHSWKKMFSWVLLVCKVFQVTHPSFSLLKLNPLYRKTVTCFNFFRRINGSSPLVSLHTVKLCVTFGILETDPQPEFMGHQLISNNSRDFEFSKSQKFSTMSWGFGILHDEFSTMPGCYLTCKISWLGFKKL